jgi:hypothetical protein
MFPITLFYSFEGNSTFLLGAGYTAASKQDLLRTIHFIGGFKIQIRNNLFFQILATPFYLINPRMRDPLFMPLGWVFSGLGFLMQKVNSS